jgi:hypothetical protein
MWHPSTHTPRSTGVQRSVRSAMRRLCMTCIYPLAGATWRAPTRWTARRHPPLAATAYARCLAIPRSCHDLAMLWIANYLSTPSRDYNNPPDVPPRAKLVHRRIRHCRHWWAPISARSRCHPTLLEPSLGTTRASLLARCSAVSLTSPEFGPRRKRRHELTSGAHQRRIRSSHHPQSTCGELNRTLCLLLPPSDPTSLSASSPHCRRARVWEFLFLRA